ncbi:MAG TPA: nickel-dependent hydrogenase large subunit [Polyangiaceae bacterium]
MSTTVVIDPVTRIEGHIKIRIAVDTVNGVQQIVDAWASGTLFRGFERILLKRHPWDAPHICERICGVCPISQATASVFALENVNGVALPPNAVLLRNLIGAANFIDSHILSFYHLSLPDFVQGPAMAPWQPAWQSDKRVDSTDGARFVQNYVAALAFRRKAQELGAVFSGRMPHPSCIVPGGITTTVRADRVEKFRALLLEIQAFVQSVYLADVELLATHYPDYFAIGRGHGHLLAFGAFGTGERGLTDLALKQGFARKGALPETVRTRAIAEQVTYSWYAEGTDGEFDNLKPHDGVTNVAYPKTAAYSWLKAPRYHGLPCEVGPLARQTVAGIYTRGVSVMDRHLARVREAVQLIGLMLDWLEQLSVGGAVFVDKALTDGLGEGLTEAPRGALGHWLHVSSNLIGQYQVVTPTCWNASPRDAAGLRGPIEESLVGTPIRDVAEPVEALRVLHSFDPCTACAVHVTRPDRLEALTVLQRV